MSKIDTIVMPKWGLAMQEGMLAEWSIAEGDVISKGQEIADIETAKITNAFESPIGGKVRRLVTPEGDTVPVGFLLAVCAEAEVSDAEVDAFVETFKAEFVVEDAADGGAEPELLTTHGGATIRYLAMGTGGRTVVFVHGFGGDYLGWLFNQEVIAESHTTYAIDLPGHGGSTKDVGDGNLGVLSAAVADFLVAKDLTDVHLVGHSMGGAIALDVAAAQPDRVAGATLLAPLGLSPSISGEFLDGFISQSRAKKLRGVLEMLVHDPKAITAEMIEEVVKYKRIDGVIPALQALRAGMSAEDAQRVDLRGTLADLAGKVQIHWGKADRILPPPEDGALPVPVIFHHDTGHLPHMEQAAEVNRAILAALG